MTRTYRFDRDVSLPIVIVRLFGRLAPQRVQVIFDSGAVITQFHTHVIDSLGYSARDAHSLSTAHGPAGPMQEGYYLSIEKLEVFGKAFAAPIVAAYDFDHLADSGVGGLLGFDIIKQLHIEVNGPQGTFLVY